MSDIETLALSHLHFLCRRMRAKSVRGFSPAALEAMRQYAWPGNLREMRNVIERAVILSSGELIEPADLAETIRLASEIRLGGKFTLEADRGGAIRRVVANTRTLDEAAGDPRHRSGDALSQAQEA